MIRTSTLMVRGDAEALELALCSTRSSFDWASGGSSPISSRNSVPPLASSKRPIWVARASVKAPFSRPNSSLSISVAGSEAQSTLTKRPRARGAHVVDGSGGQSLAGPGLAQQQHGRLGRRDLLEAEPGVVQRVARADELDRRMALTEAGKER